MLNIQLEHPVTTKLKSWQKACKKFFSINKNNFLSYYLFLTLLGVIVLSIVYHKLSTKNIYWEKVNIPSSNGATITGTIFFPEDFYRNFTANAVHTKDRYLIPAVLLLHGFLGSRQSMHEIALALVKNLKVAALAIDLEGHGESQQWWRNTTDDASHAIEYLRNTRVEVNKDKIAIIGHSIGGTTALNLLFDYSSPSSSYRYNNNNIVGGREGVFPQQQQSVQYNNNNYNSPDISFGNNSSPSSLNVLSTVAISASVRPDFPFIIAQGNNTVHTNIMYIVGRHEEVVNPPASVSNFAEIVGLPTNQVEKGRHYGSFHNRTARKLLTPPTDHFFALLDFEVITQSLHWLSQSLNIPEPSYNNRINVWLGKSFISLFCGICWLSIPLSVLYFCADIQNIQAHLMDEYLLAPKEISSIGVIYVKHIILHGLIVFACCALGTPILVFFPVGYIGMFVGWFLLGWLFFAMRLWLVRQQRDQITTLSAVLFHPFGHSEMRNFSWRHVVITLLAFLIGLFLPLQLLFAYQPYDYRFVLPLLAPLYYYRFAIFAFLWLLGTMYFCYEIESLMQLGITRKNYEQQNRFTLLTLLQNFVARSFPFLMLITIMYLHILVRGQPMIGGMLAFYTYFLVAYGPMVFFLTFVDLAIRSLGYPNVSSAIILSGIISWQLSSCLPYEIPLIAR